MDYNAYEPTAWKGEIPESLDIVDDDKQELSKEDTPPAILEITFAIMSLIFLLGMFGAGFTFFTGLAGLFLNSFYWPYIKEDPVTFYILVAFVCCIALMVLSFPYTLFFSKKYARYIDNNISFSGLFNKEVYKQLAYPKEYPLLPSKIFNLIHIHPKDWTLYRSYALRDFTWDETCLTHYDFHQTIVHGLLRGVNNLNIAILIVYFPIILLQYFFNFIYLPVYQPLMIISVSLFIVTRFTNKKGSVYADITFNRRDGFVTFSSAAQQEWKCHFNEINAYVYRYDVTRNRRPKYCLALIPRLPLKQSRCELLLKSPSCGDNTESITELWQVINQFMNVTLPLPFVVPLEDVRDKDPTTQNTPIKNNDLVNLQSLEYEEYRALLEDNANLKLDVGG